MPTKIQSDITPAEAEEMLAMLELQELWGEAADDPRQADLSSSYRLSCPQELPAQDLGGRAEPISISICRQIEFEAVRGAPGEARRRVTTALLGMGYGDALIQDAALLVSELTANAVVHAGSSFSLSVSLRDWTLRIEVADRTPLSAGRVWAPRQGRGLGLIDAICTRWGTETTAEGKVVWGELQL